MDRIKIGDQVGFEFDGVLRNGEVISISSPTQDSERITVTEIKGGVSACFLNVLPLPLPRKPTFTPREVEVLRQICRGLPNKEIAVNLGISPSTIKGHVSRMFDRIKIRSRVGLVVCALKHGVVSLAEL